MRTATNWSYDAADHLADSEDDKQMVWDELGTSGYIDLLEEN